MVFIYTLFLFSGSYLPDNDLYYHTAIAKKYLNLDFSRSLTWTEISIQSTAFTDYHFLFHILEIPFLILPFSEFVNLKLFILFCLAFSFFQLSKYLSSLNPEIDSIFASIFFCLASPLFTGRMLFGRGIILFIGFYFLYLRYLRENKIRNIFIISFFSVWCYAGFPLLAITNILCVFYDYSQNKKINFHALVATFSGLLTGFLFHPSFPNHFSGYYTELILQSLENPEIEPIAEWLPPDRSLIFNGVWFILSWLLLRLSNIREWKKEHVLFLSLSIIYLIFSTASLRLFEMFWLFAFLFIFVTTNEQKIFKYVSIAILVFLMFPFTYTKMTNQYRFADPTSAFDTTAWINRNVPKNERIFLSWGDFPLFVYKSPQMRYLYGMNPLYAWKYDSRKYNLQRSFFEGSTPNFQFLPGLLGYKYVVINKFYNQPIFEYLKTFRGMELVYENKNYRVFFIRESEK